MSSLIIMVAYRVKHQYGIRSMEHEGIAEINSLLLTEISGRVVELRLLGWLK